MVTPPDNTPKRISISIASATDSKQYSQQQTHHLFRLIKRIDELDAGVFVVGGISCGDCKVVLSCCSGDKTILDRHCAPLRFQLCQEFGPCTCGRGVELQHIQLLHTARKPLYQPFAFTAGG